MTRRSREVGIIKSFVLGAALAAALARAGPSRRQQAGALGDTVFTTDYMFRGISNANENPRRSPSSI